jgi:hypothetical protein
MTAEEDDREWLREHPAHELSLWQDWVQAVCRQRGEPQPTGREWDVLMKTWHHGKAPLESADELALMRKTPNANIPVHGPVGPHTKD